MTLPRYREKKSLVRPFIGILAILNLPPLLLQAQNFQFLDARAKSLAGVSVTTSRSAYVFLHNPANLALYRRPVFSIDLNQFFEYDQIAVADLFPHVGVFGMALGRLRELNDLNFVGIGYGRAFDSGLQLGLSAILYRRESEISNSWDLGVSFHPSIESNFAVLSAMHRFLFAACLQNASLTKKRMGPPLQLNLGLSYQLVSRYVNLYFENQLQKKESQFISAVEFHSSSFTTFRSGISNFDKANFLFGMGIQLENFNLDLVYNRYLEQFQFSCTIRFGESPVDRAARYFRKGNDCLRENRIKAALSEYQKAMLYDPNNPSYRKRYEAAIVYYQKIREEQNRLLQEARSYEKEGEFLAALVRYIDLQEKFPENPSVERKIAVLKPMARFQLAEVKQRAVAYLERGDLVNARIIFDRLKVVAPEDSMIQRYSDKISRESDRRARDLYARGLGYYLQNNFDSALQVFEEVMKLNPEYSQVRFYVQDIRDRMARTKGQVDSLLVLARRREKEGKIIDAIQYYGKVLKLDGENESARKALSALRPKVNTHIETLLNKARTYYEKKNYLRAEALCQDVLQLNPGENRAMAMLQRSRRSRLKDAREFWTRGEEYLRQKNYTAAVEMLQKARQLDRSEPKYENSLRMARARLAARKKWQAANEHFKKKQFSLAEELITDLLETFPNDQTYQEFFRQVRLNKERYITTLLQEGIRLYSQEKYLQAVESFNKILEIDPKNQTAKQYKTRIEEKIQALKKLK